MNPSAAVIRNNRVHREILNGVFSVMDCENGMRYLLEQTKSNAYWEGITQRQVTNLFVWSLFGDPMFAALNYSVAGIFLSLLHLLVHIIRFSLIRLYLVSLFLLTVHFQE